MVINKNYNENIILIPYRFAYLNHGEFKKSKQSFLERQR
jgi:hypothetical protein